MSLSKETATSGTDTMAMPYTDLHMEIQVPWIDSFELGRGIDALTGAIKGRALEDFDTRPPSQLTEGHRSKAGSRFINNLRDLYHENRAGVGATINLGSPATLGMKIDYAGSAVSSTSSSMVEHWVDGSYDFERASRGDLKFTTEAQECLEDPTEFRKRYGDYFVCGFQRRYNFRAVVSYRKDTVQNIRSLGAGIQVGINNVGGVEAKASHYKLSGEGAVVQSAFFMHSGCDAILPAIPASLSAVEDATEAMAQTIQASTCRGVRQVALLRHYSDLFPTLPTTVPVREDVFSTLHDMDDTCIKLELDCLHPAVRMKDRNGASEAIALFRQKRATLLHDSVARDEAFQELHQAARLVDFSIRLVSKVKEAILENPPPSREPVKSQLGNMRWRFGMTGGERIDGSSDATTGTVRLADDLQAWEFLLKTTPKIRFFALADKQTFEFRSGVSRRGGVSPPQWCASDSRITIIGFSLSCDNSQGTPIQFVVTSGGILSNHLSIDVTIPRGCKWHCRVTGVPDEWGDFARLMRD